MKKILIIIVVFLCTGCKKFLNNYSQDLVVVESASDLDELILGSGYLPSAELASFVSGRNVCPWLNFLDDDVNSVKGTSYSFRGGWDPWIYPYLYGYTTWQLDVNRSYDKSEGFSDDLTWNTIYNRINVVNIILKELETYKPSSAADQNTATRIEGEARFLRAQYYLLLTNLYGDAYEPSNADTKLAVPLKLTEYVQHQSGATLQFSRATVAAVYQQIVEDLNQSVACFKKSPQAKKIYRASEAASLLLLSRVHLYMQNWELAKTTSAAFLVSNNTLSNILPLKEEDIVITENNREVVFSHGHLNLQNVLTASSDDFCVSDDLVSLYDQDDMRKTMYFKVNGATDSISLSNKFKKTQHRSYVSDLFMLRNAEGYLNVAEAAAMLNDDATANNALNTLRKFRINNYVNVNYTAEELVSQIRNERRKELCFEGHRWFDLRRYAVNEKFKFSKNIQRIFNVFDQSQKTFVQTEVYELPAGDPAYTFAIPKSVIEFESATKNNPRVNRPFLYLKP